MSEVKEEFWSKLDGVVHSIPRVEKPVIGADFSEHVGEANRADEKVLGRCSAQERNIGGQMVCMKDGNGCGEDVLQEERGTQDNMEWRKVRTGGIYLMQKVKSRNQE